MLVSISIKKFHSELNNYINNLLKENKKHLSNGDTYKYQMNCNKLSGISYTIQLLNKYKK